MWKSITGMSAAPEVIDRKPGDDQGETGEALAWIGGDLVEDDREADQREADRHERKAPCAECRRVAAGAPQRDRAERECGEENPLGVNHP